MTWSTKITDTAKLSPELRYILFDRTTEMLSKLGALQRRAMSFASPEAIGAIAPRISLPSPGAGETEQLQDSSRRHDFPWLSESTESLEPEDWVTADDQGGEDGELSLGGTWMEELSNADEEIMARLIGEWETREVSGDTCDLAASATLSSAEEKTCCSSSQQVTHNKSKGMMEHPLNVPWHQSFPAELEEYVDALQTYVDSRASAQDILLRKLDRASHNASSGAVVDSNSDTDSAGETASDSETNSKPEVDLEVDCNSEAAEPATSQNHYLILLKRPTANVCGISADNLIRLQSIIQQTSEFRSYLSRSLQDIKRALNRREDRYRLRETEGDITTFMRSRGLSSPLTEGISIDEEWPEQWEWGLPIKKEPRPMIQRGPRTSSHSSEVVWA
ncbi:hypothetical protein G7046_g506 [Stylonectria norvegica]|nr:hypothetical protein G7046_g506 [Stylonectria norvegica]